MEPALLGRIAETTGDEADGRRDGDTPDLETATVECYSGFQLRCS